MLEKSLIAGRAEGEKAQRQLKLRQMEEYPQKGTEIQENITRILFSLANSRKA